MGRVSPVAAGQIVPPTAPGSFPAGLEAPPSAV